MPSASFTRITSWGTPSGHKIIVGTLTGGDNYVIGTGDNVSAGNVMVNAITTIIPSPANGYVPVWDNSKQCLRVYALNNIASNGVALTEAQSTTNFAAVSFPCQVIGKP